MIALDKKYHILAGVLVGVASLIAVHALIGVLPATIVLFVPVLAAFSAGFGKEAWDQWQNDLADEAGVPRKHTVDPNDVYYTAAGGLFVGAAGFILLGMQGALV